MPTAAERQALAFLAGVALLGGGARAFSFYQQADQVLAGPQNAHGAALPGESAHNQLAAVDSARALRRPPRARARGGRLKAGATPTVAGQPGQNVYSGRLRPPINRGIGEGLRGDDIVVDADVATITQLQMLPRISPLLAERIVANRDSFGPFGALSALGRVRGMSIDIRNEIRNLVVFTREPRSAAPRVPRQSTSAIPDRVRESSVTRRHRAVIARTKK